MSEARVCHCWGPSKKNLRETGCSTLLSREYAVFTKQNKTNQAGRQVDSERYVCHQVARVITAQCVLYARYCNPPASCPIADPDAPRFVHVLRLSVGEGTSSPRPIKRHTPRAAGLQLLLNLPTSFSRVLCCGKSTCARLIQ